MKTPEHGEIWRVKLDPEGQDRYAVIISSERYNATDTPTVLILPMEDEFFGLKTQYELGALSGLDGSWHVACDIVYTIEKKYLMQNITSISRADLINICRTLEACLELCRFLKSANRLA